MTKPTVTRRLSLLLLGGAAVLALAPAPAFAADFGDPEQVSPPDERSSYPDLASGPGGRLLVAWSGVPRPFDSRARARLVESGSGQGPAHDLSPRGAQAPVKVAGGERDWIAAWARKGIEARRIAPDGTPGPLIRLAADGDGVESVRPKVAVGPGGTAYVAWRQFEPGGRRVGLAVIAPDGTVVKRLGLPRSRGASAPDIAVGPDDRATVVWRKKFSRRGRGGSRYVIVATRIDDRGRVDRLGRISSRSGRNGDKRIAIDRRGRVFVVWRRFARRDTVQSARIGRKGGVSGPHRLTSGKAGRRPYYIDPAIATAPGEPPRAVWVRIGKQPRGRLWSSPLDRRGRRDGPRQPLSDRDGRASSPEIAIDPLGRTAVAWEDFSASTERIGAVIRDVDGSLLGPELINSEGGEALSPALAIAPDRRALIAYRTFTNAPAIELVRGPAP